MIIYQDWFVQINTPFNCINHKLLKVLENMIYFFKASLSHTICTNMQRTYIDSVADTGASSSHNI